MKQTLIETNGYTEGKLLQMISQWVPEERMPERVRIRDTSDFLSVDYDDVVVLDGIPYFVRNNEREGRFGLDDEQKFWVKRAIDLKSGQMKIIKWAFRERFTAHIGGLVFECVRSPQKEERILDIVRGRTDFMQGRAVKDASGNPLRVMDFIHGKTLEALTRTTGKDHEDFFFNHYPALLAEFIRLAHAIRFLHENGEKHGDIRRDHVIRDSSTGQYRWIDFDYNYQHSASKFGYDLFGLGNVLIFITGREDVTVHDLRLNEPDILSRLCEEDLNIVFHHRVANLKKIYPYIPELLNRVLMHFSAGAKVYYENTIELLEDLGEALDVLE